MDRTDQTLTNRLDRAATGMGQGLAAWWRANAWGLGFCWLMAFLAHGAFLAAPVLMVDEELFPLSDQTEWLLRDGRWALWAFKSVTAPIGLAPYQCTVLALVLTGLAAWLAASALENRPGRRYLVAALFATNPVLAYVLAVTFSGAGVLFGLACATGACLLARRARFRLGSRTAVAGCAVLVCLGFAAYQSLGLVYVTFAFLYSLRRLLGLESEDQDGAHEALGFVAVTAILGLALHMGVDALAKQVEGVALVRDYQADMFEWGRGDALTVVSKLADGLVALFGPGDPVVGAFTRFFPWLVLAAGLMVLGRKGARRGAALATLAGACLTPFALHAALGHALPARTLHALVLCGAGLYGVLWDMARPWARAVLLAAATVFVVNNAYTSDKLHEWQTATLRQDAVLARELVSRIQAEALVEERGRAIPVAFVGKVLRPDNPYVCPSEFFGRSFFEWDGGNSHRMISFMRFLGYLQVTNPPLARKEAVRARARKLPPWPAPGSVTRLPDGVVAVNLGN